MAASSDRDLQRLLQKDLNEWSVADVGLWLACSRLGEWKMAFLNEGISGAELLDLSKEDLIEIGMTSLGDRKAFFRALGLLTAEKEAKEGSKDKPSFESSSQSSSDRPSSSSAATAKSGRSGRSKSAAPDGKVCVKLIYRGERETIHVEADESLRELRRRAQRLFGKRMTLCYRDSDGDIIDLTSDRDWRNAKRSASGEIRIKCSARTRRDQARKAELDAINTFINPTIMTDSAGVIVAMNPSAEEFFGYQRHALVGSKVNVLMPDEYASHHDQYMQNYLRTGVAKVIGSGRRVKAVKRDGKIIDVYLTVSESRSRKERHFIGTLQDISVSDSTLITVDQTEHFTILQSLLDPAIVINQTGIVQFYNPAAAELFGHPASRVVGRNISMLMQGKEKREHDSYLANYLRTGKASVLGKGREVVGANARGELLPLYLQVTEQKLNNQSLFTGIIRPVQQSAATDSAVGSSDIDKIRDVLEALLVPSVVITDEGTIQFVNSACEELLGCSSAAAVGKNVTMLMPAEYAAHHDEYLRRWRETGEGTVFGVGRVLPAKHCQTGASINVRLSVSKRQSSQGRWLCVGTLTPLDA